MNTRLPRTRGDMTVGVESADAECVGSPALAGIDPMARIRLALLTWLPPLAGIDRD